MHDDDTVATPPKGQKTGKKEYEMTEKTILITRNVEDKDAKANFRFHHIQILQELNNSFPTVQIYDNNNNIVTDMEDMAKWSDPLKYMSHFKLHQKSGNPNRPPKAIVAHRIITNTPMQEIKNNPRIARLLSDQKLYIRYHNWDPEDLDTVQLGVLIGIDPISYHQDAATIKVNTALKKAKIQTFPAFKLYRTRAQVQVNQVRISSHVYMLEVRKKDVHTARKLLQKAYEGTKDFAFMALKSKFPKAFANALRTQNQYLRESYTVIIANIPESAYPHLRHVLGQHTGITDVLKHQRDKHLGKYVIMTTRSEALAVRNYLKKDLGRIINQFPKAPTDTEFDTQPQVLTGEFDEESSDGISWYSNSATTFNSVEFSDSNAALDESSTYSRNTSAFYSTTQRKTYAEVAKNQTAISMNQAKQTPPSSTERQHHTTSDDTDTSTEISSIRSLLSQYQMELERQEKEHQAQLQQQQQRMEAMFSQMQAMTMMFIQHSKPELVDEFLAIQNPKRGPPDADNSPQSTVEKSPAWKRVDTKPSPMKKNPNIMQSTSPRSETRGHNSKNRRSKSPTISQTNSFEYLIDNRKQPIQEQLTNDQTGVNSTGGDNT